MIPTIQILVLLLIVIVAVAVVAARLKIPPAILLVITGVILALIPGLPTLSFRIGCRVQSRLIATSMLPRVALE
jgi:NhaP-type Na+/H+ or K+/H+ antiporter